MFNIRTLSVLSVFALVATAAFPPKPQNVTTIQSTKFPGVSLSYKEVSATSQAIRSITHGQ